MGIKNMPKNLQDSEKSTTFALANEKYRGVEQLVARQAHNLEVIRSSRISATIPAGILLHRDSGFFLLSDVSMLLPPRAWQKLDAVSAEGYACSSLRARQTTN